jgi:cell wall assembly regulator SMI1
MKQIRFAAQARLVSPEDINAFEITIGRVLPRCYRDFLLEQSGGYVDSELNRVDANTVGLGEIAIAELWTLDRIGPAECVLWSQCQKYADYLSEGWLAIGRDANGDLLLINIGDSDSGKTGEVILMYVDLGDRQHKMLVLADSFSEFLDLILN